MGFGFLRRSAPKSVTNIADYLDTIICVTDLHHRLLYANAGFTQSFSIKGSYEGKICYEGDGDNSLCSFCGHVESLSIKKTNDFKDFGPCWEPRAGKWLRGRAKKIIWSDGKLAYLYQLSEAEEPQAGQSPHLPKNTTFFAESYKKLLITIQDILGNTESALDENISEAVRSFLNHVLHSAKDMQSVASDVVLLSQLESGSLILDCLPFCPSEVLLSCLSLVSAEAEQKNIMLNFEAKPCKDRLLMGDPARFGQVCSILLSNAVKYTEDGLVNCSLTLEDAGADTCKLSFELKDSGIGMSEELLAGVFEPFLCLGQSRTGLSLPIASRLVGAMGGCLTSESAVGLGSRFSFNITIPIADTAAQLSYDKKLPEKPCFGGHDVLADNKKVPDQHTSPEPAITELSDDQSFFQDMLRHFVKYNQNFYDNIRAAIAQGDLVLAHRLAHNMKGNAGHIQKTTLQNAAMELEQELKHGRFSEALLDSLRINLEIVLQDLRHLLVEEDEPVHDTISQDEAADIFIKLAPLLESGNIEYLDYLEKLKGIPGSGNLIKHMENFDSVAAAAALAELRDFKK